MAVDVAAMDERHQRLFEFLDRVNGASATVTADEVAATGMVNKVVPRDQLDAETRALAEQIAKMPTFALRQAKRAVNQTLDVQGFYAAIQSVFDIHQTGHGHAISESGLPVLMLLDGMKKEVGK